MNITQEEYDRIVRDTFPPGTEPMPLRTYYGLLAGVAARHPRHDWRQAVTFSAPLRDRDPSREVIDLGISHLREWFERRWDVDPKAMG